MELDGLVVWYISVEHVRRKEYLVRWVSTRHDQPRVRLRQQETPCSTLYLSVQAHEQKQFTKLCNYHLLKEKKLAFTIQLTRQNSNAGLRIRILKDLLRVDLHSIKTAL
jgi:hypothetical protein